MLKISFIGDFNDVYQFTQDTIQFLIDSQADFISNGSLKFIISGSNTEVQATVIDFKQIEILGKEIKESSIVILYLNFANFENIQFGKEKWVSFLKNIISESQQRFIIGQVSDNFNTNEFSQNILEIMNMLNFNKYFERRSDMFLPEEQHFDSLTIFPNFNDYLSDQIKIISNSSSENQEEKEIEFNDGPINFILFNKSLTAKVVRSQNAANDVLIKKSISYDSKSFIVTEIEDRAFQNTEIKSLSFDSDSQVKRIGNFVFQNSTISSFSIPGKLEELGKDWCKDVEFLVHITVSENNKHFQIDNGLLINIDNKEIIFAKRDFNGELTIPNDIKKIGPFAFYMCTKIQKLVIDSDEFDYIDTFAFNQCKGLQNIYIPKAKQLTFGDFCFSTCKSLVGINISCEELIIERNCFQLCSSIACIDLPNVKRVTFGQSSMIGCDNIIDVIIPNSCSIKIKSESFLSLKKLNRFYLYTEQLALYNDSFEGCSSLSKIYVNAKDEINSDIFKNLSSLKEIDLTSFSTLTITKDSLSNMKDLELIRFRSKNLILEEGCFKNHEKLTSVVIRCENSINFASDCFEGCSSLKFFNYIKDAKLNASEKVELSENLFSKATNLNKVQITANEIIIGNSCFDGAQNLQKVVLYGKSVTAATNAFSNCTSINSFTVGESEVQSDLDKIVFGDECFSNTKNINEFKLTANEISIGSNCFKGVKQLNKVVIHGKNVNVSEYAFNNCNLIKTFAINDAEKLSLAKNCFLNHESLEEVEITATEVNIGQDCFNGAKKLHKIILNGKNINVGGNAFNNCAIKSFVISKSDTNTVEKLSLLEQCFYNLESLKEVEIAATEINIGQDCFNGAKKLQKITLYSKIVKAAQNAFSNCSLLTSFTISGIDSTNNIDQITLGNECFLNASKIEKFQIAANEISIGSNVFNGVNNLQEVSLCGKIINIEENAFCNLSSLKSFTINESSDVKNAKKIVLAAKSFFNAKNITALEILADEIEIGCNCFSGAKSLKKVVFNCKNVKIDANCFNNCTSLNLFEIKESKTSSIGSKQFIGCSNLEQIKISVSKNALASTLLAKENLILEKDSFEGADHLKSIHFVGGNVKIPKINSKSIINLEIDFANYVEIGPNMFNDGNLKKVTIVAQSFRICQNCFNNNSNLESVIFATSHADIKKDCFKNDQKCKELQFIGLDFMNLDSDCFCGWDSLTELNIDTSAYVIIGQHCFNKLGKLKTIKLYSKRITIGTGSFQECSSLTTVNFIKISNILNMMRNTACSYSPKGDKIKSIFISDEAFKACNKLNELNIEAEKEILIGQNCFYKLYNLGTIKLICDRKLIGENSFLDCPGFVRDSKMSFISSAEGLDFSDLDTDKLVNNKKLFMNKPPKKEPFKNDKRFDSLYVLGINKKKQRSIISMFPARPVTFPNEDINTIPLYCYPNKLKTISIFMKNESNITNGFVFYFQNESYIGVVLQFYIPRDANSFVGDDYDRSYPFSLCLITNNTDIASHFTFLHELVHPIVGKVILPREEVIIPPQLQDQTSNCYDSLYIKPKCPYIAVSGIVDSMDFLLPKLIRYYTKLPSNNDQFLDQSDHLLLYPTLQTLLTCLSPETIVEVFLAMLCEYKVILYSNQKNSANKTSFCILAFTNLMKGIDISSQIIPFLPFGGSDLANTPFPSIIGWDSKCQDTDLLVNLDNNEVEYFGMKSVIQDFPYSTKMIQNIKNLLSNNLSSITIPFTGSNKFKQNAHKTIYPECFQYFVHTKFILTPKFVQEFSNLFTNPFVPSLRNFISNCLITDSTNPDLPVTIFNSNMFMHYVQERYKNFMNVFRSTTTFDEFVFKLENETQNRKNPREIRNIISQNNFSQTKTKILLAKKSAKRRMKSCSSTNKKKIKTLS